MAEAYKVIFKRCKTAMLAGINTARKNEYKRVDGHWVTPVGSNGKQLIFHDPSPRAGGGFSNEFEGRKSGLPTKEKGMHIKSSAEFTIIDGVVYFGI